jgi:hypothetical protein
MDTSRERSDVRIISIGHLARVRHWLTGHFPVQIGTQIGTQLDSQIDAPIDSPIEAAPRSNRSVEITDAAAPTVSPAPDLLLGASGREKPDALHS